MKSHWSIGCLNFLLLLLIVAMLVGCASPVVPSASTALPREQADRLAQQVARQIGGRAWVVAGTSMVPVLADRSVIVAEPADFDDLRAGDVVVYSNSHLRPIIHRLVAKRGDAWQVKGDALAWPDDELVTRSNFLGRQCAVFFTQP